MKLAPVFDPSRQFPAQFHARKRRGVRGAHATLIAALMKNAGVWAKVSPRRLPKKDFDSLAVAIRSSSRFGLHFQVLCDEDGFCWARYVGREAVPVRSRKAA